MEFLACRVCAWSQRLILVQGILSFRTNIKRTTMMFYFTVLRDKTSKNFLENVLLDTLLGCLKFRRSIHFYFFNRNLPYNNLFLYLKRLLYWTSTFDSWPTELTCDFGCEGRTRDILVGKLHCDIVLSWCCRYVCHGACAIFVVTAFNFHLGRSLNSQWKSSCACIKTIVINTSNTIWIAEPNYPTHIQNTRMSRGTQLCIMWIKLQQCVENILHIVLVICVPSLIAICKKLW